MNTYCGTTKLRTRKLPILWTGQNAEHIHDNHVADPEHRPLHLEIQKALQAAGNHPLRAKTYVGIKEESGHTIAVTWYKISNLAEVKSAMKHRSTGNSLLRGKGVGATANTKLRVLVTADDLEPHTKEWLAENEIPVEKYVAILNKTYNAKTRKR